MAIKGSSGSLAARRLAAPCPRAEDRMPLDRRPVELRLHLLRKGAHLLRLDRQPPRPPGGHPRQARHDHAGAARRRDRAAGVGARQEARPNPGRAGGHFAAGPRTLHAGPDRGVGLLPVHLDSRDLPLRNRHRARSGRTSWSSINPESLLLEGARRVDEWSLIEKKIPSFDLIFIVDRDRLAIAEGAAHRFADARACAARRDA